MGIELKNNYIELALKDLIANVGLNEYVDHNKIVSLIESNKIKEAINYISLYLGLPLDINVSYISKDYNANNSNGFTTTQIVKTDAQGLGVGEITAQIIIPSNLPDYGSPKMLNFPIKVLLSENCGESPATLISVMAHELSLIHI